MKSITLCALTGASEDESESSNKSSNKGGLRAGGPGLWTGGPGLGTGGSGSLSEVESSNRFTGSWSRQ